MAARTGVPHPHLFWEWWDGSTCSLRRSGRSCESFAGYPKLVGVRHVVQGEPDDRFLLRPEFLRGVSTLEEFDLAYDILIYARHLPVAAEFVQKFPRQRFVLDHLAKPPIKSASLHPWAEGIRKLAALAQCLLQIVRAWLRRRTGDTGSPRT